MSKVDPPLKKPVGAVSAAIRILRYLGSVPGPVGVTQIARGAAVNQSTCFNILRTLLNDDLVGFDPVAKTYQLSFGLAALARPALEEHSYIKLVRPHLQHLANEHRVTTTLWYRVDHDRVMLVDTVEAGGAIRIRMTLGQRLPRFIGALGRCMAAAMGLADDELRQRFEGLRWETPLSFEQYRAQVDAARRNGYAIDEGYFARGITTVSSAILDPARTPVMAMSAVGLSAVLEGEALDILCRDVRDAARQVENAIGQLGRSERIAFPVAP